jgi:glycosyltransferase involved in cell wall biosynthesis
LAIIGLPHKALEERDGPLAIGHHGDRIGLSTVEEHRAADLVEQAAQGFAERRRWLGELCQDRNVVLTEGALRGGIQMLTERAHSSPTNTRKIGEETSTPRVSVIIPCYKTANFVAETLESVFAQTYRDFEVVVVNDGSPDTPELEKAIAPWRDKMIYVHTENCGLAGARNNGIRASKGELVALLDSDDMWEPNYLEVQVRELDNNPAADIVYPRAFIFGEGPDAGRLSTRTRGEVTFTSLIQETTTVVVSVLARRSALEGAGLFDDTFRSCEDFDMWLRCLKNGSRIIHHDEALLRWRCRPDSLSADPVWMYEHAERVLVKMRTSVKLTNEEREALESAIRRFEGKRLFYEGKCAFLAGDMPLAIDRVVKANSYLNSTRIRMILFAIRRMPRIARAAYGWQFYQRISFAWALRPEVK